MSQKKKILMLIPNLGYGGAQRVFGTLSAHLSSHYDVTECIFNKDEADSYPSGNPQLSLDVNGGGNVIFKIIHFFQRIYRLHKIKKRLKPDYCISHLEGADYVNVFSGGKTEIICVIHGSKTGDKNISGWLGFIRHKLLMNLIYRRANKIVVVSRDLVPELLQYKVREDRVFHIPNFFEIANIQSLAKEEPEEPFIKLFQNYPVLITAGRLARQKNQVALIDLFARIKQVHPDLKLVICGDGELKDTIMERISGKRLRVWEITNNVLLEDADVYMMGYQRNPFKYINRSTLFILPSDWEGFPLAIGEAMACGAAIVSADCPTGPREILSKETGTPNSYPEYAEYGVLLPLLKENTEAVWADTISKLLANQDQQKIYREQSLIRIQDYTPQAIMHQWIELLKK